MPTIAADGLCEFLGITPAAAIASAVRSDTSAAAARREKRHHTRFEGGELKVERLLPDEMAFFSANYELAYLYAKRAARMFGRFGRRGEDIVETAAIDALIKVARRSSEPDFIPARGLAFLKTAVERQVRDRLLVHFGANGSKDFHSTSLDVTMVEFAGPAPDPADEVLLAERSEHLAGRWAKALRVLTAVMPVAGEWDHEQQVLRLVAHALGIRPGGTNADLVERIAAAVEDRMSGAVPPPKPALAATSAKPCKVVWQRRGAGRSTRRPSRRAALCG